MFAVVLGRRGARAMPRAMPAESTSGAIVIEVPGAAVVAGVATALIVVAVVHEGVRA